MKNDFCGARRAANGQSNTTRRLALTLGLIGFLSVGGAGLAFINRAKAATRAASAETVAQTTCAQDVRQCAPQARYTVNGVEYFIYGIGDAQGKPVGSGDAGTVALYLYGKFDPTSGIPPIFFSGRDSFDNPNAEDKAVGVQGFGAGSDATRIGIVNIPPQGSLPTTVNIWAKIPQDPAWHKIGTWSYASCADDATAVRLGSGTAYIHVDRAAPAGASVDVVNPRPVLFSTGVPLNNGPSTATAPARVHSWASGMTWANNDPKVKYYQGEGGQEWRPRATPIWADPIIAWYSSQPKNQFNNYIDPNWITQATDVNFENLGKDTVFAPGFHLSTATPEVSSGAVYSLPTKADQYSFDGRAVHGTNKLQIGVDHAGRWRETIAVFPSTAQQPFDPSYYPTNTTTTQQGDWDISFRMTDPQNADRYLEMTVAQGSPFSQFTALGTSAVSIAAAYLPGYKTIYNSLPAQITDPADVQLSDGRVRYQIIYQQVNAMNSDVEVYPNTQKSNWTFFAVMWDAASGASLTREQVNPADGMKYYTLGLPAQGASHFVIAALPNQMKNNVDPATVKPDLDAAGAWAQLLAKYAFNFYQGQSKVEFFVGQKPTGATAAPNEVNVVYQPNLNKVGPSQAGQAMFLLQPHQYSANFKDGRNGARPLNAGNPFPACTTCKGTYWIARGKLEAYADTTLRLTYLTPPMLPYFPSSQLSNFTGSRPGAGGNSQINFTYNDLAYALAVGQSYSQISTSPPAGAKFGINQVSDPYAVGTGLYPAAKLLATINGLDEPTTPPAWYTATQKPWYRKADMQKDLYNQITSLFNYYFSKSRCPVGTDNLRSFVYAYFDPATHHVALYPTGTATSEDQPQSYGPGQNVVDAFGIASKLSDSSYAYGYYINAAALLALALQQNQIAGLTSDQQRWWDKDHFGPAIDLLVKDLAYADTASGKQINWWVTQEQFAAPRLEFMDLWTGVAFADAFQSRNQYGKQHNSAQEAQLSWAGIHLWGLATGRKEVADLGQFLYTLGAYANDAYFNGTLGQLVPDLASGDEFASDYSAEGTFIPRATQDWKAAKECWDKTGDQSLTSGGRGMSAWQTQPFATKLADGRVPFITAGVYQGRQFFQGEFGFVPLNELANIVIAFEPMTLSVLRDQEYMAALGSTMLTQTENVFFDTSYALAINKFFAALGVNQSAEVAYRAGTQTTLPTPCSDPKDLPPPFDTCKAFRTVNRSAFTLSPNDWYWNLYTASTGNGSDGVPNLPWAAHKIAGAPDTCDTLSVNSYMTTPADGAGSFVDFAYFDRFGTPDFTVHPEVISQGSCLDPDGAQGLPVIGVAFRKNNLLGRFAVYNPNCYPVKVKFVANDGSTLNVTESDEIHGYSTGVWSNLFGFPNPGGGDQPGAANCASVCLRAAEYYLTTNRLPSGTVLIYGVNGNNPVSTSNWAVRVALRGNAGLGGLTAIQRFNQQYVAFQLNLLAKHFGGELTSVLQTTPACYGLNFSPTGLSNGATLRTDTTLGVILAAAQQAAREHRANDLNLITSVLHLLNGNDPQGRCKQ